MCQYGLVIKTKIYLRSQKIYLSKTLLKIIH